MAAVMGSLGGTGARPQPLFEPGRPMSAQDAMAFVQSMAAGTTPQRPGAQEPSLTDLSLLSMLVPPGAGLPPPDSAPATSTGAVGHAAQPLHSATHPESAAPAVPVVALSDMDCARLSADCNSHVSSRGAAGHSLTNQPQPLQPGIPYSSPEAAPPPAETTAERIRRLAPRPSQPQPLAPTVGMRAQDAVALVQSMASAPGHPTTHAEDVARVAPIASMFAAGLGPQSSATAVPSSLSALMSLYAPRGGPPAPAAGGLAELPHLPQPHMQPAAAAPALAEMCPPAVDGSLQSAERAQLQTAAAGSGAALHSEPAATAQAAQNGDGSEEERLLDVLEATMDAWEGAIARRMAAMVTDAVKAARADVMQVCAAASVPRSLYRCLHTPPNAIRCGPRWSMRWCRLALMPSVLRRADGGLGGPDRRAQDVSNGPHRQPQSPCHSTACARPARSGAIGAAARTWSRRRAGQHSAPHRVHGGPHGDGSTAGSRSHNRRGYCANSEAP